MPDPGWVRIYHPDQCKDEDGNVVVPDPDDPDGADNDKFATVTEEAYELAWKRRDWRNLDEDRYGAAPEDIPENAKDRIAWIDAGDTAESREHRATAALNDEMLREPPRSTVVDHANEVLSNTSVEEQTTSTTSDEQES